MSGALIQLAYKQTIDAGSQTAFETQIFSATFAEFAIQQQSFSKGQDLFSWPWRESDGLPPRFKRC